MLEHENKFHIDFIGIGAPSRKIWPEIENLETLLNRDLSMWKATDK